MRKTLLILTSAIALAASAHANTQIVPFDANFEMVEEKDASTGAPYITGGVGKEELETIRKLRNQYNTTISIADVRGFFLAGIMVSVIDQSNATVLSVVSKGPYVLTTLPAGTYTVKASQGPNYIEKTVRVPARGQAPEVILLLPSDQPVYGEEKRAKAAAAAKAKAKAAAEAKAAAAAEVEAVVPAVAPAAAPAVEVAPEPDFNDVIKGETLDDTTETGGAE